MHTFVFEMMSRLIAKGIIRSYSMQQRRVAVKPPIGIISNCDVCGEFMFDAKRYMHMNDAYFAPSYKQNNYKQNDYNQSDYNQSDYNSE